MGIVFLLLACTLKGWSQTDSTLSLVENNPTKKKKIEIVNADVFDFITDTTDQSGKSFQSKTIRKFDGNVQFHHKNTDFFCDKATQYMDIEVMVAKNNVHIEKPDSFTIDASYLVYYGKEKLAKFRGNVVFEDSTSVLKTDSLDYDLNENIGLFWGGGSLQTDSSTLISEEGVYYHNKKEAFFYGNVHLANPEFDLYADSMRYDTKEKVAYFISETKIVNGDDIIYTNEGYFDTKTNTAKFEGGTEMTSGSTKISADDLYYDKNKGYGEAQGNVIWEDTAEQITILANYTEYKDSLSYVMATDDPLLIDISEDDTMYLSADTLITFKIPRIVKVPRQVLKSPTLDSIKTDSIATLITIDDSLNFNNTSIDSLLEQPIYETFYEDSLTNDSIRIFYAYNNTKVLNGSLSGVCDSFYFSTGDSIFRLHQDPMVWVDTTQFSGDSISVHLVNKELERILIHQRALIIHENGPGIYDQTKGKLVEGFFKDEHLTKMEISGNGESIYFIQDDSSAYVGGNKTLCSRMIIRMKPGKDEVDYITFITKPEAVFSPFKMISIPTYKLEGFVWKFEEKPKNVKDIVRYWPLYEYFLQYLGGKSTNNEESSKLDSESKFIDGQQIIHLKEN